MKFHKPESASTLKEVDAVEVTFFWKSIEGIEGKHVFTNQRDVSMCTAYTLDNAVAPRDEEECPLCLAAVETFTAMLKERANKHRDDISKIERTINRMVALGSDKAVGRSVYEYCRGCLNCPKSNHGPWDEYSCHGDITEMMKWLDANTKDGALLSDSVECPVRETK